MVKLNWLAGGSSVLASQPIIAFIPTRNYATARAFYEGVLGLRVVSQDPFALVMDANGTMLRITAVGEFTPHHFTTLGWQVADIGPTVAALAAKGVEFQRYSFIEQDAAGVWSAPGGAKVAWFLDPDGNILSLSYHPEN